MMSLVVNRIYVVTMIVSIIAVVGMALYMHFVVYKKFLHSKSELSEAYQQLRMVEKLRKEQEESLKTQEMLLEVISKRPPNFDFFSYINQLLRETQLTDKAKLDNYKARSAHPRQPMLQVRLDGVSLKRFSEFLHRIYSDSYLVAVYKVDKLKPNQTGKGIDCDLTLVTLK